MKRKIQLPTAITLIMLVIILAAISTWILPAGQYNKIVGDDNKSFIVTSKTGTALMPFSQKTLDSLNLKVALAKFRSSEINKPLSVPNTYERLKNRPQGVVSILQAPIKGIIESIDIILFILFIGGSMRVFNQTGAMLAGVAFLANKMQGRERLLIVILTSIFSFFGGSYGMDVESIVFYPVLMPIFLAAGYDALVPLAIVFGGTSIGYIASFSNPFSTIIASNTLGINWFDGFYERIFFLIVATALLILYILRYADKVKKVPTESLVFKIDGILNTPNEANNLPQQETHSLPLKTTVLLLVFFLTFSSMITGIIFFGWWTLEMSTLFFSSAILIAIIDRIGEKLFVSEFIQGMASLLSVAVIVGLARGVTIVLNDGLVSDSILYHASNVVEHLPPTLFILLVMIFYFFFTIPVTSSTGMAVLTMPIIGSLAFMLNIPGREIVNSYLFGIGIMYLLTPTGSVFPALTMVNVSYKAWLKFIVPFVIILVIVSALFLTVGIRV